MIRHTPCYNFFFFNDTATTEIYTLSLHDALPISAAPAVEHPAEEQQPEGRPRKDREYALVIEPHRAAKQRLGRSEEHTSELQSRQYLVCRLLLEKKKPIILIPSLNLQNKL